MTAVLDDPDAPALLGVSRPASGFPYLDVRLVQVLVELAAEQNTEAEPGGGSGGGADSDVALIDQIGLLESLGHSVAAWQAALIRRFARRHVDARITAGESDPAKVERSVAARIGLACRVSPTRARGRVRAARDLADGLSHVRGLYAAGDVSSRAVEAVVRATRDLDRDERGEVDRRLAAHDLTRLGPHRLRDLTRTLAAEVAPEKFRARVAAARAERRVTLRPGEDGMTWLTAHLPVEQGVACLAALDRAHKDLSANPEPLTRGRGQVMADTLVWIRGARR